MLISPYSFSKEKGRMQTVIYVLEIEKLLWNLTRILQTQFYISFSNVSLTSILQGANPSAGVNKASQLLCLTHYHFHPLSSNVDYMFLWYYKFTDECGWYFIFETPYSFSSGPLVLSLPSGNMLFFPYPGMRPYCFWLKESCVSKLRAHHPFQHPHLPTFR